jgi:PAS domain S-box-containing protein
VKKESSMEEGDRGSEPSEAVLAARDAVIEALPYGIILVGGQSRVLDINPAAQRIVGEPAAAVIGQPVKGLGVEWAGLIDLLQTAGEHRAEVRLERDGEERAFELRVTPLPDERGRAGRRLVMLREVTERKQVERALREAKEAAERSDRAKSEFMSVASHEMRTPITSIKGYTDLLSKETVGPINAAQAEFLDTIRTNADRIALLISDLSDMARIESGRLRLEIGLVDVVEVVRDAVEGLRAQIEAKDQTLSVAVAGDLPPARADYERSVQVLSNLIGNAHKFTPAGGRLIVRARRWQDEETGQRILLAVEDNGIGIRAEEHERVFEKFYRSEDRKASDLPGSGLGLSIAANLVKMQGGEIWLESRFREGTTVRFTLPSGAA